MNWIANFVRPRIKSLIGAVRTSETPENLWKKCPACGEMIFHRDLVVAQNVCPQCGHHLRIGAAERFAAVFDAATYEELVPPEVPADPLRFRDEKRYTDRLKDARAKTGRVDALSAARGTLEGLPVMIAVQTFEFMGGSLGMAVGEALIDAMQAAAAESRPFILFVSSGGARMQEGILSLMQMPRITIAVDMLRDAGVPYIVVLCDPTTGGVSASYAMLGDIHIAEPGALIGFAGQRVIEQTMRETLPEGFQRAEYLLEHGMVDMVVHRHNMRETLSRVVHLLMKHPRPRTRPPAPVITATPAARTPVRSSGSAT
ncbi:MAG: acetyl-CoA carboxylase carboxyltransferase subunit beta [Alphaproteobacteria bacterium]|nr:acetyl-CoA carboxylase carboxyltransferase subunit beta [Alphaproteobacteria bacterium]MDE1985583.1 acetyl-CoA carboxylase carboxyltransferase subunit beta [Alphaproteobacteria bacterium]MDE2162204.1 acetyl-CoA carboxylase carboxyltransferase subunit beta [Alphaproteobacteria bacterium]MDE2498665.1 acetyl-CoA carboxylase carboxyltransferase subunit beta [Alphaproteobacteria bacterium]